MIKTFAWFVAGLAALTLGIVGLVVPIIPGVLFLILAAFCLSAPFPGVRTRLNQHPLARRYADRWRRTAGLGWGDRIKLMVWSTADLAIRPFARPDRF